MFTSTIKKTKDGYQYRIINTEYEDFLVVGQSRDKSDCKKMIDGYISRLEGRPKPLGKQPAIYKINEDKILKIMTDKPLTTRECRD